MRSHKKVFHLEFLETRTLLSGTSPDLTNFATQFVEEGSVLAVQARVNNPVSPVTYSLDPGFPAGASINSSTGLFLFTPPNIQTIYTISVRATDSLDPNLTTVKPLTVLVFDVPPVINAGSNQTIFLGTTLNRMGFFTDPNPDIWTGTVDYGDGTGVQPLKLNPDKTFTLNHDYKTSGTYTVSLQIMDSQSFSGYGFTGITVTDLPQSSPQTSSYTNSVVIQSPSNSVINIPVNKKKNSQVIPGVKIFPKHLKRHHPPLSVIKKNHLL